MRPGKRLSGLSVTVQRIMFCHTQSTCDYFQMFQVRALQTFLVATKIREASQVMLLSDQLFVTLRYEKTTNSGCLRESQNRHYTSLQLPVLLPWTLNCNYCPPNLFDMVGHRKTSVSSNMDRF